MSDPKPCRHIAESRYRDEKDVISIPMCNHPMVKHYNGGPRGAYCHGCPCHEPLTDPTPTGNEKEAT